MVRTLILTEADVRAGPYGVDRLPAFGYDVTGVRPLTSTVTKKLRDVIEHRSGQQFDVPLRGMRHALSAELVLGIFEDPPRLAARMKSLRIPPYAGTPLVIIECWLAERLRHLDPTTRRRVMDAYRDVDLMLALSRNQIDILVDSGLREDQVDAIPFGCAPEHFDGPPVERDLDVVAAGFDRGRDYGTLFEGIRGLDVQVQLLCSAQNLTGLDIPANVTVRGVVPYEEYIQTLRRAKIVAVPTRQLAYPTGQSVSLDAASAGAALAFTGTQALGEYFDDSCAAPVAPGDADGWRAALSGLLADDAKREALAAAGRTHVRENYTYDHMWAAFRDRLHAHGLPSEKGAR